MGQNQGEKPFGVHHARTVRASTGTIQSWSNTSANFTMPLCGRRPDGRQASDLRQAKAAMNPYRQIIEGERYAMYALRMQGFTAAAIGRAQGRHRCTITREFARNSNRASR